MSSRFALCDDVDAPRRCFARRARDLTVVGGTAIRDDGCRGEMRWGANWRSQAADGSRAGALRRRRAGRSWRRRGGGSDAVTQRDRAPGTGHGMRRCRRRVGRASDGASSPPPPSRRRRLLRWRGTAMFRRGRLRRRRALVLRPARRIAGDRRAMRKATAVGLNFVDPAQGVEPTGVHAFRHDLDTPPALPHAVMPGEPWVKGHRGGRDLAGCYSPLRRRIGGPNSLLNIKPKNTRLMKTTVPAEIDIMIQASRSNMPGCLAKSNNSGTFPKKLAF